MANIDPVQDFLSQELDQGVIDSTGVFTLDPARAWEKANTYNLPFWGAWVLKLVQVAVLRDCSSLHIQQNRATTSFHFRFQEPHSWDPEILKVALFDFGVESPPGISHLAEAILFLTKKLEHTVKISTEHHTLFCWDGENLEFSPEQLPCSNQISLTVSHIPWDEKGALKNLISRPGKEFSIDISNALTQHCYASPIPIHLDNRLIAGLHNDPKFSPSEQNRPFALLHSQAVPELDTMHGDFLQLWSDPFQSRYLNITLPSGWLDPPREAYGILVLCCAYVLPVRSKMTPFDKGQTKIYRLNQGPSTLVWVQNGVIVGRENLEERRAPVGFLVVAGAQGLATDVTGLQLIENEARSAKKDAVLKQFAQILERRRTELQGLEVSGMGTEQLSMLKVQTGMALFAVLPFGCYLAYSAFQLQKKLLALEAEMQTDLRRNVTHFEARFCSPS